MESPSRTRAIFTRNCATKKKKKRKKRKERPREKCSFLREHSSKSRSNLVLDRHPCVAHTGGGKRGEVVSLGPDRQRGASSYLFVLSTKFKSSHSAGPLLLKCTMYQEGRAYTVGYGAPSPLSCGPPSSPPFPSTVSVIPRNISWYQWETNKCSRGTAQCTGVRPGGQFLLFTSCYSLVRTTQTTPINHLMVKLRPLLADVPRRGKSMSSASYFSSIFNLHRVKKRWKKKKKKRRKLRDTSHDFDLYIFTFSISASRLANPLRLTNLVWSFSWCKLFASNWNSKFRENKISRRLQVTRGLQVCRSSLATRNGQSWRGNKISPDNVTRFNPLAIGA